MSEKTEKATPYKLQKAKEKGQVCKSIEITTCVNFLVMIGLISALWPKKLNEIQALLCRVLYLAAHIQFNIDTINQLHQFILNQLLNLWLPFALASAGAIILANMAQTGLVWSTTPLIPDFKRLHVIHGFKKLFSLKTCFETAKNILKIISTFIFLYFILKNQLPNIIQLTLTPPSQHPEIMLHFLLKLMFQLLLLLALIAILDKFYMQWNYSKNTRMSKQEIKDEYKQKEGDPKIKYKIKQLQQMLRQKTASLNQVKSADVVITNPAHLAIALKYERNTMPAPKVVCKAQGDMVLQVKQLARQYGVPVIENKSFARMLYHTVDLNQWINEEHYPIAAAIFQELYTHKKEK